MEPNAFNTLNKKLDYICERLASLETVQPTNPDNPEPEYLNVQQAAEYLGLTPTTVYGKVHRRELPHLKPGNRLLFVKAELENYLLSGRRKTQELASLETVQPTNPDNPEPEYLNVHQAAEYLGLTVSTVYGKVHRRELPHLKRGHRLFFVKAELENYLLSGRRKTQ